MYLCTYACNMYVCLYACMHVCMYVCMYVFGGLRLAAFVPLQCRSAACSVDATHLTTAEEKRRMCVCVCVCLPACPSVGLSVCLSV